MAGAEAHILSPVMARLKVVPLEFLHFQHHICSRLQLDPCQSVPAPDFSPGERVFKPAKTLYLSMTGL